MSLQPILTPCNGAAVDLCLCVDGADPEHFHLYWGTALLQRVPRDPNSLLFRVTAGLLTRLGLKMKSLEDCLGVTAKTLRKWGEALRQGDWELLAGVFHGAGAAKKLSPDIERYVRVRYREARDEAGGRGVPYGFRVELLLDLLRFWDLELSGEVLRRVFRDEDARGAPRAAPVDVSPASGEPPPGGEPEEAASAPGDNPIATEAGRLPEAGVAATGGSAPEAGSERADPPVRPGSEAPGDEGCASAPAPGTDGGETRNIPPAFDTSDSVPTASESDSGSGGDPAAGPPLLSEATPCGASISQHGGLFLLAPWFEQAFGRAPEVVRQTAAQVLLGAVNREQAKQIDYAGLGLLTSGPVRDLDYRQRLFERHLEDGTVMDVYTACADLLSLRNRRVFYVDPHHKEYTGIENVLYAWCGRTRDTRKGILMDFIHTEEGAPCFVGHFDNYYDARERFVLLVERFRGLFPDDAEGFVWIHDRGYWAREFLDRIAENGDVFIQWEKGYTGGDWNLPSCSRGRFTLTRKRNRRSDRIRIRITWREQFRDTFPGGRRLIVRVRRPGGAVTEVAIVTNHPSMTPGKVIRLMLGRWLQENDFAYLGRHLGINELDGRTFDSYETVAPELEDREVESREYRQAAAEREKLRRQLGRELVSLNGMPPVSLEQVDSERDRIRAEAEVLTAELDRVKVGTPSLEQIDRLASPIRRLIERLKLNRRSRKGAEARAEREAEAERLTAELTALQDRIRHLNRTESRLMALIDERCVRPDLRRKALFDAIRVTCRNVFGRAFSIFRAIYDDYRDDHVILRALSRSPAVVVKHPDRVDLYLTPALHRQPAQWDRIRRFTDICTHRCRHRFGAELRFRLGSSDRQIFAAVARAVHEAP